MFETLRLGVTLPKEAIGEADLEKLIVKATKKRNEIKDADLTWLTDPRQWKDLPHPSLTGIVSPRFTFEPETGLFSFMGRLALQKLIDDVASARFPVINILGTQNFGKSHIIAAYVTLRMQACFKRLKDARPILFLPKCGDLATLQELYLKDAMLLAFAADDELLAEIAGLPEKTASLLQWLKGKTFDVAADQGNDIQEKSLMDPDKLKLAKFTMAALEKIVTSTQCRIMTGYSANNEIMTMKFHKERNEFDITFFGGLEVKVQYCLMGVSLVLIVSLALVYSHCSCVLRCVLVLFAERIRGLAGAPRWAVVWVDGG